MARHIAVLALVGFVVVGLAQLAAGCSGEGGAFGDATEASVLDGGPSDASVVDGAALPGDGWIPVPPAGSCVPKGTSDAGTFVSSSCKVASACGGSPDGTWIADRACTSGAKAFSSAFGVCSALSLSSLPGAISGTISLANGTITRDLTISYQASLSLPNACTGCRCTDAETSLKSTGLTASCSPVCQSGICSCFATKSAHLQDAESYTVNGSTITTASGRSYTFCAAAGTLTIEQTAPSDELLGQYAFTSKPAAPVEVCDGLDNDNNGLVDDNPRDCPPCSQLGVCATTAIARCLGASGWECGSKSPAYQKIETQCDGLDNDCDGTVDETKKTCASYSATCGAPDDGCGGKLSCGTCNAPQTCGGGAASYACGCTPSCAGKCGGPDGCGGTCANNCVAPQTCGGGNAPNVCGCTKTTCQAAGAECGAIPDGCGGMLACPACTGTQWCGGGGMANKCGCTPSNAVTLSPTVAVDDASSGGSRAWAQIANVYSADAKNAQVSAMINGETSHYLVTRGYGFAVPSFATIDGIEIAYLRSTLSGTLVPIVDDQVKLVKGGAVQTTNKATATPWDQTPLTVTYGGPADLWGATWTPADVNAAGFGAALSAKYATTAGNNWPYVDHVQATVSFSVVCQ